MTNFMKTKTMQVLKNRAYAALLFAACAGIFFMPCFAQRAWAADPPPNVTNLTATPGNAQITISWSNTSINCASDAYGQVVILRNTATIIDRPGDGTTYSTDDFIGASRIVRGSTTFACASAPASFGPNTGLSNGQRYYYKVFAGSSSPNYRYASGVEASAVPSGPVTTSGRGTIMRRTSYGDNTCGGENNACHNVKTHNSINTASTYWTSNWGTGTSSKYGKIVCQTCHQPHATRNIYIIRPRISFPDGTTNPLWPSGRTWVTVDYRYRSAASETDWSTANYALGNDNAGALDRPTGSTRICEVCHSQTKFHRYNTSGQTKLDHNNARRCTQCHNHQQGFKRGGEGGAPCDSCHDKQVNPMKGVLANSTKTYHMVIENSDITTLTNPSGFGFGERYPNQTAPSVGSSHKRCLFCHVEMENFSPKLNTNAPAGTLGRAYNLRKSILTAPSSQTDTSRITNMDYNTTYLGGGICTSCHQYEQTKDTTKQTGADRTVKTPEINPSSFERSTHNFYAEGGGFSKEGISAEAADATTFMANCTKCHNDTLEKNYQSATYKFGLHDSELRRLNAPMSLATTSTDNKGAGSGTVTAFQNTGIVSLTAAATWTTNAWRGRGITISAGTGFGQTRIILSNTQTVITVSASWSPVIAAGSFFLLGDPIEEEVCFRCHSTSTASNPNANSYRDFYNAKTFQNTRAMRMEQVFNTVNNPYGHLIANYAGIHKTDEYNTAPLNATSTGWFTTTRGGPGRHIGCTDCHNPHAARKPGGDRPEDDDKKTGNGVATSYTNDTSITLVDSNKTGWTQNQWRGYVVRILSGSGAGQDRLIMSNSANTIAVWTSWETLNLPSTNSYYIVSPLGHPQYGNMLSNVNDDAWGVTIGTNWPQLANITSRSEYIPTLFAGTFFTKIAKLTGNSDKIYNLCFKCHSAYGWGTSNRPFTIPYAPTTTGLSADIAARFNPNNLAHHAVYEKGENQPIQANYNVAGVSSSYNLNWPYWKGSGAARLGIATSGWASVNEDMAAGGVPLPVLPGWFVWIGTNNASDAPNNSSNRVVKATASGNYGFFEITQISTTSPLREFKVSPSPAVAITSTSVFSITAGFGNNFVPPYGPWSVVSCTDCHDTDNSTDPSGPHASARKWILRNLETQDFPWYNGTNVIRKRYSPTGGGTTGTNDWKVSNSAIGNTVCVNCHRADVYGVASNTPYWADGPGNDGRYYINMNWTAGASNWGNMSRQHHAPDNAAGQAENMTTYTNIMCMGCHGGGARYADSDKQMGVIHGTSLGRSLVDGGASEVTGGAWRGKRFLTGGAWTGLKRGSVTGAGTCYTDTNTNAFTTCGNSGEGTFGSGRAYYDYEIGPDY